VNGNKPIEQIMENAAASVEMEGYTIDRKSKEWCQKLLRNEITMQEYISLIKKKAGVKA
jgi:hypothetical protein